MDGSNECGFVSGGGVRWMRTMGLESSGDFEGLMCPFLSSFD